MKGLRIPVSLCVRCKGYKRLCGLPRCPLLESFQARIKAVTLASSGSLEGATPPSIIIGEAGYPRVPILYGVPPGKYDAEARVYGDVKLWAAKRYTLTHILRLRSSTIYATTRVDVRNPFKLYEAEIALAAVSVKPVETEAKLRSLPVPRLSFDNIVEPSGPLAPAAYVRVEGDPKPPRRLEKLVWDDVDARTAVLELYRDTGDVYAAINALALGLLGRLRSRRLVPTRWAITAVDSIVGNELAKRVKDYKDLDKIMVYHAEYLGNRFTIILLPGGYGIEMVEAWHPYTVWTKGAKSIEYYSVRETVSGKPTEMDGGFMAARLAVLEHLNRIRRRALAIIVREVTRDYYAPVGNWHIRETVRRALASKPLMLNGLDEVEEAVTRLHPEARKALSYSTLYARARSQRRLDDFFTHS